MCGIFGFVGGDGKASRRVLSGLKQLEYRGYDSYGVVAKNGHGLVWRKAVGKVSEAEDGLLDVATYITIGHTRWATHGKPNEINAHPHFNDARSVAVVHNGIIENYTELMMEIDNLAGKNVFVSETDTEVIAHLVGIFIARGRTLRAAVCEAARKLSGRFAFAAVHDGSDSIVALRRGSPLSFGWGDDGLYLSSDLGAFPDQVKSVCNLDDHECVVIPLNGNVEFFDYRDGELRTKRSESFSKKTLDGGKFPFHHYMAKEIADQQAGLTVSLVSEKENVRKASELIRRAENIVITGCGTAGYVSMVGQYLFAEAGKRTDCVASSEFDRCVSFIDATTLLIAITQSGETADVLEAIAEAKKRQAKVVVITNVDHSTAAREADSAIDIHVGREVAVASTKAASAQIIILTRLALSQTKDCSPDLIAELMELNGFYTGDFAARLKELARSILDNAKQKGMFLIGRGVMYPIALEGALKTQEVAYIHAMGYAGGELKHGPLALVEGGTPAIALIPEDRHKEEILANASELKARGANIIGIAPRSAKIFDQWIKVPDVRHLFPIAAVVPLQMLAYYLSVAQGIDPDRPRNLAKSVTVK